MSTRFERITYLGRNNNKLSLQDHVYEMRETHEVPVALRNEWYEKGIKKYTKTKSYVKEYYKDTDYYKSSMSDDELLSQIQIAGGHSRLLKIAGRRLAEKLDEIDKVK